MRHDPAGASIVIMLRSLKLHGMVQAVEDLVAQGAPAFEAATPMLSQLLEAEMAECERQAEAAKARVKDAERTVHAPNRHEPLRRLHELSESELYLDFESILPRHT